MELRLDRVRHRARVARRKASVIELDGGASQRAGEVVVGLAVAARKAGTSEPKDGMDRCGGDSGRQHLFCGPKNRERSAGLGGTGEGGRQLPADSETSRAC